MGTLTNETTRSQLAAIRAHLLEHGWIDKPTALVLCDCDRLSARIHDLRHDPAEPMNIETQYAEKRNRFGHLTRYAVYRLAEEEQRI